MLHFAHFHHLVFPDYPQARHATVPPGTAGSSFWLIELTWERIPSKATVLWEPSILSENSLVIQSLATLTVCSSRHFPFRSLTWWWFKLLQVVLSMDQKSSTSNAITSDTGMWCFVSLHCGIGCAEAYNLLGIFHGRWTRLGSNIRAQWTLESQTWIPSNLNETALYSHLGQ